MVLALLRSVFLLFSIFQIFFNYGVAAVSHGGGRNKSRN